MRQLISIHLISLFLFSTLVPVQVREGLVHLPEFLEHFKLHRLETPGISFFHFLQIHYGEDFANHQDDHDHSQLPCKAHCNHLHSPTLVALQNLQALKLTLPCLGTINRPVFQGQPYHFSPPGDIWQPPKA